jgi:hypothetical protein
MKKGIFQIFFLLFMTITHGFSQTNPVINLFPQGTVLHGNVPYNTEQSDTI